MTDMWCPDDGLVHVVMTRGIDIRTLDGPDRAWVVASLIHDSWTVPQMADKLQCSQRLVWNIRVEPMVSVFLFSIAQREESRRRAGAHDMDIRILAGEISRLQTRINALEHTRRVIATRKNHDAVRTMQRPMRATHHISGAKTGDARSMP